MKSIKNQEEKSVFDFGFRYMGMGHIEVVSCDLDDFKMTTVQLEGAMDMTENTISMI